MTDRELLELILQKIGGMDSRVADMDSRVADMDSRMADMDSRMADMDSRMADMDSRMAGIEDEMGSVKSELAEVKFEVRFTKETVIKIEKDHGQKLGALFDGYKLNSEKLDRIEAEVAKHEEIILRRNRHPTHKTP